MKEVIIELRDWEHTCSDGCCHDYGTKVFVNGKELEHPNEEVNNNMYVGSDIYTTLQAVLKELGYKAVINQTWE